MESTNTIPKVLQESLSDLSPPNPKSDPRRSFSHLKPISLSSRPVISLLLPSRKDPQLHIYRKKLDDFPIEHFDDCDRKPTLCLKYSGDYNRQPTCAYTKEHTIYFEYLGRYCPEPYWKRWLSPFRHQTAQNAFCRGMRVYTGSPDPPYFLGMLSRAVKRRLSRGYRVEVVTPNRKFYTKVTIKYTGDQDGWRSFSMTFEDGHGYWESCGFDWGKTPYLHIRILLQRRPDQPRSRTCITFLIQEEITLQTFLQCRPDPSFLKNVWPRFYEALNKYNEKYQKRYHMPLPEDIIDDFCANFRYNILTRFRENVYCQWNLDDWGFSEEFCGFDINDNQQFWFTHDFDYPKIIGDLGFALGYIMALQTSQLIGYDFAIMPWARSIWKPLRGLLNSNFDEINVENWDVMFGNPTQQDDFSESNAPEVASSAISESFAIYPADEATTLSVSPEFIQDLPFKVRRWCDIRSVSSLRIPSNRGFQFRSQKTYSAFANKMDANAEILQRLELFKHFFEEILAVPIMKCKTNELEKFAVEAFLLNAEWTNQYGYGGLKGACIIRGATAHCLGQYTFENFNRNGEKATAWLNSWSCNGRVIGLMVMVHWNENGLVLPPKVAPKQVIVSPGLETRDQGILDVCNSIVHMLCEAGIRADAHLDNSAECWEYKGVPLFVKVGPEVFCSGQVEAHRRDRHETYEEGITVLYMTSMVEQVYEILADIQESLYEAAKRRQDACIQIVQNWAEFVDAVRNMRVILAPWCDEEMVEKDVKAKLGFMRNGYGVKILCSPLEQPQITEDTKCFASGKPAKKWTYWGRRILKEF